MAWTTPRTWTGLMQPGATGLNTELRDNLNALKNPPFAHTAFSDTAAAPYATTGTVYIAINATTLSHQITTFGGALLIALQVRLTAAAATFLDFAWSASGGAFYSAMASAVGGATTGLFVHAGDLDNVNLQAWLTGLASGTYTIRPIWKVGAGTTTATVQSSGQTVQFWVREMS